MLTLIITTILIVIIQYYICIMTYINWFRNEITYCKMKDSYSIIAMVFILPIIVWIPILPVIYIWLLTERKYLTIRWMF